MAYSKDLICNMTLGHLGVGKTIQGVATELSAEAEACNLWFDPCRRTLLEMIPWDFATEILNLQEITITGTGWESHWKKLYAYPSGIRRANRIINPAYRTPAREEDKIPFKVVRNNGQKAILCDQDTAILEVNIDVEEPAEFSATFSDALSLFIATRAGPRLNCNAQIMQIVERSWMMWQGEAIAQNITQSQQDPMPTSSFAAARS
jgi:hypothetical protein